MKRSVLRPVDAEWLRWLQVNVERGCSREELVKTLLANGFDDASVVKAMKQVLAGAWELDRIGLPSAEAELDHPVDGVHTAAADADYLDDGEVVLVCRHDRPSVRTLNLEPLVEG